MKIGIISDTHGKNYCYNSIIKKLDKVDRIIHLGDHCADGIELANALQVPVDYVRGNCDFTRKVPDSKLLVLDNRKIFITHGHIYNVKYGLDRLVYKAMEVKADLVFFGHTHIPQVFYENGILFMNPGSASCPHYGKRGTVGIVHLQQDKEVPYIISLKDKV